MNNEENKYNLPPVVTVESLTETHDAEAVRLYHEISQIGGFGDFTMGNFVGGHPPLVLVGLSDEAQAEIAKLLAVKAETPPNPAQLNKIPATATASSNSPKEGNE